MTMTVEDGTGLANSNSYASIAEADAFFADRGSEDWEGSDAEKEYALIAASDYIDARFGGRLRGQPLLTTQAMEFPRKQAYDRYGNAITGVPDQLKEATFQYAVRHICGTDLSPDPVVNTEGALTRRKQKLGPMELEVEFSEGQAGNVGQPYFPEADRLMRKFLAGGTGGGSYR